MRRAFQRLKGSSTSSDGIPGSASGWSSAEMRALFTMASIARAADSEIPVKRTLNPGGRLLEE